MKVHQYSGSNLFFTIGVSPQSHQEISSKEQGRKRPSKNKGSRPSFQRIPSKEMKISKTYSYELHYPFEVFQIEFYRFYRFYRISRIYIFTLFNFLSIIDMSISMVLVWIIILQILWKTWNKFSTPTPTIYMYSLSNKISKILTA